MIDHPFAWPLRNNLRWVSGMFIAISGSSLRMIHMMSCKHLNFRKNIMSVSWLTASEIEMVTDSVTLFHISRK